MSDFCWRMSHPDAQTHTRQGHEVGEHLNAGVDVDDSPEMAQSNDNGAGGHENDKGQAHEDAVRDGHAIHFIQEWDQERRNPSGSPSSSSTASPTSSLGASTGTSASASASTRTSILLGACDCDYELVSIVRLTVWKEAIQSATVTARAESFMLLGNRAISVAMESRRCGGEKRVRLCKVLIYLDKVVFRTEAGYLMVSSSSRAASLPFCRSHPASELYLL